MKCTSVLILLMFFAIGACSEPASENPSSEEASTSRPAKKDKAAEEAKKRDAREPDRIELQLCILACEGARLGFDPKPAVEAAEKRAAEILDSARGGADFEALVLDESADPDRKRSRGLRKIANWGVMPDTEAGERPRSTTPALADAAFKAEVGSFGLVSFDPETNPLGFIVFKRLR